MSQKRKSNKEIDNELSEQAEPLMGTNLNGDKSDDSIPYADEPQPGMIEPKIIITPPPASESKLKQQRLKVKAESTEQLERASTQDPEDFGNSDSSSEDERNHSRKHRAVANGGGGSGGNSDSSDSDDAEAPTTSSVNGRNLRRNSISMPLGINALELEALRVLHQQREPLSEEEKSESRTESAPEDCYSEKDANSQATTATATESSTATATSATPAQTTIRYENEVSDDDSETNWKPKYRDRFRNRRRASIAPLPALRLNSREMIASDFDAHSIASNQASITSINSIASLLREKMQSLPQKIRKKKRETKDYKIKLFVIFLFFIIVFLVGYAYVAYHQQVLTRSYFDKIKFKSTDRILRILSHDHVEVISAQLGVTLGWDNPPFRCLEDHKKHDGSICIEWNGLARLYMNFKDMDVFRCYTLRWEALAENIFPTDCYQLERDNGLWFGGGMTKGIDWSLSSADFDYSPYSSGDLKVHQFGNAVKRYFINSIGVAMQVDPKTPLHLRINKTKNEFCLRAKNDDFTFVNHLTPYPTLDYKICTTEDMRSLHMLMTQTSLWDGLKEEDFKVLNTLLEEPIWKIPFQSEMTSINETTIYDFSEEVIGMGFMRLGHILVNEFWQENIGDFTVDQSRFPTLKETIDVLHRRGFKVVFTIQPFISTDSFNFKEAVRKKLLIYERFSERSIPALTRYKTSSSAGVLDITNNASIPWLIEKLEILKQQYQVDSFYLDLGTGYNLPHYYQCRVTLDNPDMYSKLFTSAMESVGYIGVSTASVVPRPPAFLSTPPINSSWDGLRELVSTVLNYGVIGYPFILPGAIGGDYLLQRNVTKMVSFYSLGQPELPEEELYMRWLQLETFLPAMQFSHLPSEYKSDQMVEIAKEFISIRQKVVLPLLRKYLSESMNEGLPLVRPLWMLDPRDSACLMVSDEFSIGEELIVAPILEKGSEEREVYLPQGVWKDGIDGSLRKGSRWIHNYKVPKEKIAYFIKMPDNTRF